MKHEQVELPCDYFARKVKTEYVDWVGAFIRELFQNHVDSFIRMNNTDQSIDFVVEGNKITSTDNGRGMNRSILEDVLLKLLESDKGDGHTGGKGEAKELLYFAHPEWSIRTHDLLVRGNYINYTIEDGLDFVQGTQSVVCFDEAIADQLTKAFMEYVAKCSFNPRVTWNGEEVKGMGKLDELERVKWDDEEIKSSRKPDDLRERLKEMGMVPFDYDVYKMPDKGTEVYVRSGGLFIFSRPFRTDMGIIFEIPAGYSKYMLTGNRDEFLSFHKDNFTMLMTSLAHHSEKLERALFGNEREDQIDHEAISLGTFLTLSSRFDGEIAYEIDNVGDIFYDHNLDGTNIRINLDPIAEVQERQDKKTYKFMIGMDAKLSNDKSSIVFDKIFLPSSDEIVSGLELSSTTLTGKIEGLQYSGIEKTDEGVGILGSVTHSGRLVIHGPRTDG